MINNGDMLICNLKNKNSNIFWKKSTYLIIKNIEKDFIVLTNEKMQEQTLSTAFIQHLLSEDILLKVNIDSDKAKYLLAFFGENEEYSIINT